MGFLKKITSLFAPETKKQKKNSHKVVSKTSTEKPNLKVVQGGRSQTSHQQQNAKEKQEIAMYQQKIAKMLQDDPHAQKRAAQILSDMVNKNKSA